MQIIHHHTNSSLHESRYALRSICVLLALLIVSLSAHAARYVYDDNGRIIGVVDSTDHAARYRYDAAGNLLAVDAAETDTTVFGMHPNRGSSGTTVNVLGNALSPAAGQQVAFGNTAVTSLLTATPSQLTFSVPEVAAGTYALALHTAMGVFELGNFEVTSALGAPTISSMSQDCARFDAVVSVTGSNFDVRPGATRVEVGGRLAQITGITSTSLNFRAPQHSPGGPVRVTTEAGSADSAYPLYLVTASGNPCLDLTAGTELQVDGGAISATLAGANKTLRFAFHAEHGQWLSFHFANPSSSNFNVEAEILAPEGRRHALLDVLGNRQESQRLKADSMSMHLSPIERTGFHVLSLKLTTPSAVDFDARVINSPMAYKNSAIGLQASPGQSLRLRYAAQAGDQLGLGLKAQNSTPDTMHSAVYFLDPDHIRITPEPASHAICPENMNCSLNIPTLIIAGDYPIIWAPQSQPSVAEATLWISDDRRPQLHPNFPQQIAINRIGQNARFPVYAEAGSGFSINVRDLTLIPASAVNFWLYAPDGTRVTTGLTYNRYVGYFHAPGVMISAFQLPMTGMYTAVLDPGSGGLANGQIVLDPGIPITVDGLPQTFITTHFGSGARFTIDGIAGQKIGVGIRNIELTPSVSTWVSVRMYLPSGDLVTDTTLIMCYQQSPSHPGCELDLGPLPVSGTYVFVIDGSDNLNAARFEVLATSDVERDLSSSFKTISINRNGGNAKLYFDGTPGLAKTIHIKDQSTTPVNFGVTYNVLRPDGFPLVAPLYQAAHLSSSTERTLRIGDFPISGTYTVFVDPDRATTANFDARISNGVLDNSPTPVLQSVVEGPWFLSTLTALPGTHPSVGVQIYNLTNPSGSLRIEVVDPLYRRLIDFDAAANPPHTVCPTHNQVYCDFDFMNVATPGTHQIVVWPGTPRREDAHLAIMQTSDLETTGRDVTFSTLSAGQNGRVNFSAESGEQLKLELTRQPSFSSSVDVWVYLFDPIGNRIGYTSLSSGRNSTIWNLPTLGVGGTYSVVMDTRYGVPMSLRAQILPQ